MSCWVQTCHFVYLNHHLRYFRRLILFKLNSQQMILYLRFNSYYPNPSLEQAFVALTRESER